MINKKFLTLLTCLTALIDKQHRIAIEYLKEENKILREQLQDKYGVKRIILTKKQKQRLAKKAKPLGRKLLGETTLLFKPATILGWYRDLIGRKYDGSANRKGGRRKISKEKVDWVIKLATENPNWGAGRISNYMKYLKMEISKPSVWRIMVDHGFDPNSQTRSLGNWKRFIKSHFEVLAATDFFSYEVLTRQGLIRYMILFVIDISTRRVHIAGISPKPTGDWMLQMARNLTDYEDGFLNGKRYLIHDRDSLFTKKFAETIKVTGVTAVKTVRQSPNMNAYAERFVQTIKHECLNHLLLTNERQLSYAIDEFVEYYHHERPHEGLGGKMISPLPQDQDGQIVKFERLGGLLKSYRRVKNAA